MIKSEMVVLMKKKADVTVDLKTVDCCGNRTREKE
jgi:hypothetical protein